MTKEHSNRSDDRDRDRESHSAHKEHKHKKDKKDHKKEKSHNVRHPPDVEIDIDDYFTKSEEFRVWLKLKKSIKFEDLTTKEAKKLFEKDFAKDYNKGKLDQMYYTGNIPLDIRESVTKSQYKWGLKLSEKDKVQLSDLVEDVDHLTRDTKNQPNSGNNRNNSSMVGICSVQTTGKPITTTSTSHYTSSTSSYTHDPNSYNKYTSHGMSALDEDNRRDEMKSQYHQKKHNDKVQVRNYIEENAPKELKDGRERMIDARKTKGDAIHGAHRAREEERDGLNLSESVIMGGDTASDYASMLARSRQNQEKRTMKVNERQSELQAKQREREANFMAQLGIDPSKGRIQIAPRND